MSDQKRTETAVVRSTWCQQSPSYRRGEGERTGYAQGEFRE